MCNKNNNEFNVLIIMVLLFGFAFIIYLAQNPITRNLGDLSDWVGSLLTVGAIFVAIKQIKNESELAREERQYQIVERKIELASPIFCYLNPENKTEVIIKNNTDYPIYDLIIGIVLVPFYIGREDENNTTVTGHFMQLKHALQYFRVYRLLPRSEKSIKVGNVGGALGRRPGAAMSFRDTRENFWVREASGILIQIDNYASYFIKPLPERFCDVDEPIGNIPPC